MGLKGVLFMEDLCNLYDIELDTLYRLIEKGVKRVLLHAPDGFKPLYKCVAGVFEGRGIELFFSSSPGYGACDVPVEEAEALGVDVLIHLGHLGYFHHGFKPGVSIVYIPVYARPMISEGMLGELTSYLRSQGIIGVSISSTIVEEKIRRIIAEHLSLNGFRIHEVHSPLLGCLYTHVASLDDKVDAHLVIAGGIFHPLGLALVSRKPVVVLDPYRGRVWSASEEAQKTLRKRLLKIYEAKVSGARVGLVIGSRLGQYRSWLIEKLEKEALEKGYRVYKVSSTYLSIERLIAIDNALNLDIYVVTSCPRLPIDDLDDFYKPVLTPGEFLMLLTGLEKYVYPW
jgi:2-(3-amino-3-carboxypropyl)histidine synthase